MNTFVAIAAVVVFVVALNALILTFNHCAHRTPTPKRKP